MTKIDKEKLFGAMLFVGRHNEEALFAMVTLAAKLEISQEYCNYITQH